MSTSRHRAHRRPVWLVPVCTVLLVAGGSTLGWAATQQVGAPPAPPAASSTKGADPSPSSTSGGDASESTGPDTTTSTTSEETTSATEQGPPTSHVAAMPASRPSELRIPAIDVSTPINPIGLDAQGHLKVPSGENYDEAAWYKGSPTPGEVGPSVIEGHVTGSGHDPSVFFELGDLRAGDRIEVDRRDGTTAVFEVTGVQQYPKGDFPTARVYGHVDDAELRVITCGGTYDEDARRHLSNIVVSAELVEE